MHKIPQTKIPQTIAENLYRTKDALNNAKLGHLANRLDDRQYIKTELESHFRKLQRESEDIPLELDWVYAQYNVTVARQPISSSQN